VLLSKKGNTFCLLTRTFCLIARKFLPIKQIKVYVCVINQKCRQTLQTEVLSALAAITGKKYRGRKLLNRTAL